MSANTSRPQSGVTFAIDQRPPVLVHSRDVDYLSVVTGVLPVERRPIVMAHESSRPPRSLNTDFFHWLRSIEETASVSFFDSPGLDESIINGIEAEIGSSLPADIKTFYLNCDPFGIVRDGFEWWKSQAAEIQRVLSTSGPVVPICLRSYSSTGTHVFAIIQGNDAYEIVSMASDGSNLAERVGNDLRQYFLDWVEYETKLED